MKIRFAILTISDRGSKGETVDTSGPALEKLVMENEWVVLKKSIVPDDFAEIRNKLIEWSESDEIDVILTTGGTGFGIRDITPEATKSILEREAPGIAEAMRAQSLKITHHAMLSRAASGIRKNTLIVNLPGSEKAATENFNVILPIFGHAVQLLRNEPNSEQYHRSGDKK